MIFDEGEGCSLYVASRRPAHCPLRVDRTSSGVDRAEAFTSRIVAFCEGLKLFPDRGMRRDDLRPGLRIIGFRRLVTIAITVEPDQVVILGIYHGGRDYEAELRSDKDD